jgi:hypothetical protein
MVIGNTPLGSPYLDGGMIVDSCSPMVTPNPSHPLITVTSLGSRNGEDHDQVLYRAPFGDDDEAISLARRRWVFTPNNWASSAFNQHLSALLKVVAGEPNTSQKVGVWSIPANQWYQMWDKSIPTSGNFRVTIRAKAKTTSGTLRIDGGRKDDGGTTLIQPTLGTSWQTIEHYFSAPATYWSTGRTSSSLVGFHVINTTAWYLAAVIMEELIGPFDAKGSGTPEGVLTAPVGSTYKRVDGGTNTSFYIKQSGTGNTGWAAVTP